MAMPPSQHSFGGPATIHTTDGFSRSSSFGSTSINAVRAVPDSKADSYAAHADVNMDLRADSGRPVSLVEKKQQRLARNRATASVSRYTSYTYHTKPFCV